MVGSQSQPAGDAAIAGPSRAVRLYGTDEPPTKMHVLRAGLLSAEFEAGNLRYIRLDGVEMIRAVSFIVRDAVWGTYDPELSDLIVEETRDAFRVTYAARVADGRQAFRYDAVIEGRADGFLRFEARGQAETDFATNRTGFVILHPLDGVVGANATIEDVEGRTVETRFPTLVEPYQPMMNLRAIAHEFATGAWVTCRMEGDTFEMEDQRNWTDASFKTYCRPIGLPWPFTLAAGADVAQSVTLTVTGRPAAAKRRADVISLRFGGPAGRVPALGIGIDPVDLEATAANLEPLRAVAPAVVVFRHDPGKEQGPANLVLAAEIGRALGAEAWLQLVVRELDDFASELRDVGATIAALGSPFSTVLVSPAADLSGTLPGSPWPACPPLAEVYAAARRAFPSVRLGGGMFAYFTELNRKRPPLEDIDLVTFLTTAINHTCDDRSVAETLESLPYIAESARALSGGRPYAVGPSGIGVRDNPYSDTRLVVPNNARVATAFNDPRQRGLLGAAWTMGYFTRFAYGGAKMIALGGGVGAFGLLHTPQDWPQPWYDGAGGLYPAYHVVRGLAALQGAVLRTVTVSDERHVLALAVDREGAGREIWIANLGEAPRRVAVQPALDGGRASLLDPSAFVEAAWDPDILARPGCPVRGATIDLESYAVARLTEG